MDPTYDQIISTFEKLFLCIIEVLGNIASSMLEVRAITCRSKSRYIHPGNCVSSLTQPNVKVTVKQYSQQYVTGPTAAGFESHTKKYWTNPTCCYITCPMNGDWGSSAAFESSSAYENFHLENYYADTHKLRDKYCSNEYVLTLNQLLSGTMS